MAQIVGDYLKKIGDPTVVDTAAQHTVGVRGVDENGNQYIYLKGVASVALGDVVSYDSTYQTSRTLDAATTSLPLAVAQAAVVANTWGWFMIKGFTSVNSAAGTVAGDQFKVSSTAGRVTRLFYADAAALQSIRDWIIGLTATGAVSSNLAPAQVNYPYRALFAAS